MRVGRMVDRMRPIARRCHNRKTENRAENVLMDGSGGEGKLKAALRSSPPRWLERTSSQRRTNHRYWNRKPVEHRMGSKRRGRTKMRSVRARRRRLKVSYDEKCCPISPFIPSAAEKTKWFTSEDALLCAVLVFDFAARNLGRITEPRCSATLKFGVNLAVSRHLNSNEDRLSAPLFWQSGRNRKKKTMK